MNYIATKTKFWVKSDLKDTENSPCNKTLMQKQNLLIPEKPKKESRQ